MKLADFSCATNRFDVFLGGNEPVCELCDRPARVSDNKHTLCIFHWQQYMNDPDFLFGEEELE
jgi:hypothetical protein